MRRTLRSRLTLVLAGVGSVLMLSGCSAHTIESKLRFGWPSGVTKQGDRMRTLWTWSSVTALIVGVIVWALIFWCCIRYRKRDDVLPRQTKYHLPIEIAYSVAPFPIILGLFFFTVVTENYVDKLSANPDTTVTVEAFKWNWQFNYNAMNYPATDPSAGKMLSTVGSATEIPILVIPRGQRVRFVEKSDDVIHSFWVPEFLFKRDVLPQPKMNQFELVAKTDGHYVGRCAELCGTYHSQMNFEVRVVEPAKYTEYLQQLVTIGSADPARQNKALQAIGEAPYATETHPFNTDRSIRSASSTN